MPSGASIYHMKDGGVSSFVDLGILTHENDVALNLLIEGVRNVRSANIGGAWLLPLSTDFTSFADFRNQLNNFLRNAYSLKELFHGGFRRVPPANMQFPKGKLVVSGPVGSEQSDHSTNVEVRPIIGSFWIYTCFSPNYYPAGLSVWSSAPPRRSSFLLFLSVANDLQLSALSTLDNRPIWFDLLGLGFSIF
jgi:hypothetical protein